MTTQHALVIMLSLLLVFFALGCGVLFWIAWEAKKEHQELVRKYGSGEE